MNVDRCVSLHNEIQRLGWLGSGKSIEEFESTRRTWFSFYGAEAEALREVLSVDLVAFLDRAYTIESDRCLFFYYVYGLHHPSNICTRAAELFFEEPGATEYVVLYEMGLFGSHSVGLIFDQQQNKAIMCVDMDDSDIICNGRTQWYPLETILEAWLDMIRQGKVKAVREDEEVDNHARHDQWINMPYSDAILDETVDIFNKLVEAVESRLPEDRQGVQDRRSGLVDEEVFQNAAPRRGFAYEFVSRVQRPQFRYIAPGLELPTPATIMEQPFFGLLDDATRESLGEIPSDAFEIPPFLLFRASRSLGNDKTMPYPAPAMGDDMPLGWPFSLIKKYQAGLYLSCTAPSTDNAFEDECSFILPFGIGGRGYARTSDGARFGENKNDKEEVEPKDRYADLYQQGHQPFVEMHSVRLVSILKNWLGMVERGDWLVDDEGVTGGIEKWKEADTESEWEKYVLPVTW